MTFAKSVSTLILLASAVALHAQDSLTMGRIHGMLIGSAIGDAAGGPVEFLDPPERSYWTTTDTPLTESGIAALAKRFRLRPYPKDPAPYAQFGTYAPAGSVTDDTRWKMILFNSLKGNACPDSIAFAQSFTDFCSGIPHVHDSICRVWQEEYGYVINYYLNREPAYPPERVWGGIPTMAGQMPFLPLAALHPGDPVSAYTTTWKLNIIDVGYARDITAVLVAGLAAACEPGTSWEAVCKVMRTVDPYRFADVPWVPRKSTYWINRAHALVQESGGVVNKLFELLDSELDAVTWWEAHVPLCVAVAFLEITQQDPLAALQLCIEFGHDTDSYAQLVGAFAGAMQGAAVFQPEMIKQVNRAMREQYHQDVNDWMLIIADH